LNAICVNVVLVSNNDTGHSFNMTYQVLHRYQHFMLKACLVFDTKHRYMWLHLIISFS